MKRALLVLAAVLSPVPAIGQVISLDRPGVLESIAAENPHHHQRIVGILKASEEMPCRNDSLHRLVTEYDAREARCSTLLMTSLPAKRRLSFTLDGQGYVATVAIREASRMVKVDP